MAENIVNEIAKVMIDELQYCIDNNQFGNQMFYIESIKQVESEQYYAFDVKHWVEGDENPQRTKRVDYIGLMEMLLSALDRRILHSLAEKGIIK